MSVLVRWRNALSLIFSLFFVGLLASCGGGDDGGGSSAAATVKSISLVASTDNISTGQTNGTAKLTATVMGSDGKPMRNAFVTFNANGNAVVQPLAVATDASGIATATLTYGADKTNRTVNVTAVASKVSSNSVNIKIGGTTVSLSVPASIENDNTADIDATVNDADGHPVEGVSVSLVSSIGNSISPPSQVTESNGVAGFAITPSTLGADTLTASITGASVSQPLTVTTPTANTIALTASQPQIQSGASNNQSTITATVKSAGGTLLANVPITFVANNNGSITPSSTTTDAHGSATATLTYGADRSNREIKVTVTANGVSRSIPVEVVGTTLSINWPYETPLGATTQYSVSVVDKDGNPIESVPVSISVTGNASSPDSSPTTNPSGVAYFNVLGANSKGLFSIAVTYGEQQESFNGAVGDPFTKIDANGNALPYTATSWAAVRDNVTTILGGEHLWWEIKADDGGPRDWKDTYNLDATFPYADTANGLKLAGFTDWVVPDSGGDYESLLQTIKSEGGWSMVQQWFPFTQQDFYWSSTSVGLFDGIGVNVISGDVNELPSGGSLPVRLVRTGK
ncbi:hypothetical protein C7H84_35940 [Burkholderia sp. Nafp2/4-1b]|uniref:Ig-like domain-containing protein n=1 Tax=Burkholderia sp. Nafp2/4-1b TaxID=2116686 RepID=UPI000EF8B1B9|nr:Ig-like domain-containing protein [Burkholderia sp. Nafp2/4-1b]RKT98647.1 hypothetical protein C7H84_35940 [Burkholderia sp. Nafp2/4-1b]